MAPDDKYFYEHMLMFEINNNLEHQKLSSLFETRRKPLSVEDRLLSSRPLTLCIAFLIFKKVEVEFLFLDTYTMSDAAIEVLFLTFILIRFVLTWIVHSAKP